MYVLCSLCYSRLQLLYRCEAHQMPETMKQEVLQLDPLLVLSQVYSNKLDT